MNRSIKRLTVAALAVLSAGLYSCKKEDSATPTAGNYAVWLQVGSYPNTSPYVANAPSLKEGTLSLTGNGAEVTGTADYGIIPHNGFYYYYNETKGRFSKFNLQNSQLSAVQEVPLTHLSGMNTFCWTAENTLLLIGGNGDGTKVLYSSIDVTTMKITNGEFALPAIPDGYKTVNTGTSEYSNGKIYVGLAYVQSWRDPMAPSVYIGVFNASDFSYITTITDNRSNSAGSSKLWMPGSFVDENGDTYFQTNPYTPVNNFPSALYRIKKGATEFDKTYFFNFNNSSIGYAAEGIWYIGNGVAVVRYTNTSLTGLHVYGFAAINVVDGTVRKDLKDVLPADKGGTIYSMTVDNGKAYILVNSETGKDYVWEYDPSNNEVKPGLEISGGYDYLLRVDKLN